MMFSAAAEERESSPQTYNRSLLLASASAASSLSSFRVAATQPFTIGGTPDLAAASEDNPLEPLFLRWAGEKRGLSEDSFVLLHKRMPSRFAYNSWANLQTGFGELFPGDFIGRSRKNGVGIEDAHCLYLKMSFKF